MANILNNAGIKSDDFKPSPEDTDTDSELAREFAIDNNEPSLLVKRNFDKLVSFDNLPELYETNSIIPGLDKEYTEKQYKFCEVVGIVVISSNSLSNDILKGCKIDLPVSYIIDNNMNTPYTILIELKRHCNDDKPFLVLFSPNTFGFNNIGGLTVDNVIKIITSLYEIGYLLILKSKNFIITAIKNSPELKKYNVNTITYHKFFLNNVREYLK